jgi:phosphatidylinositol glycan class U
MVVKEGLFLYEHGVPPYNGGVCHQVLQTMYFVLTTQAPLLLAFFSIVGAQDLVIAIVFSAVDVLCARYLTIIASEKEEKWKIAAQCAQRGGVG